MSQLCVRFIGKEYVLSEQLPTYVKILAQFEEYMDQLHGKVIEQAKNGDFSGGADEDFIYWKQPVESIAKDVITKAAEFGIYDLTLTELVNNNPGYVQLHKVCAETIKQAAEALLNAMDSLIEGQRSAEQDAASQITGSGVSIWTNSLGSALLYSAFESSAIKKQCNKADKEYQEALQKLHESTHSQLDQTRNNIKTQFYYPGCNTAIVSLISHMLDVYLMRLNQNYVLDYDSLRRYDMQSSCDILRNLPLVSKKEEVIHKAFECCPYNPDVYRELINLGIFDPDTYAIAKLFGQGGILVPYIQLYCDEHINQPQRITSAVDVFCFLTELGKKETFEKLYAGVLQDFYEKINAAISATKEPTECRKWVVQNIANKASDLVQKSASLDSEIDTVLRMIIDNETYSMLLQMGLLSFNSINISACDIFDYEALMATLKAELLMSVQQLIDTIIAKRSVLVPEVYDIQKQISSLERELNALDSKFRADIEALQKQKGSFGFFAFSQKRDIDAQIESVVQNRDATLTATRNGIDYLRTKLSTKEALLEAI